MKKSTKRILIVVSTLLVLLLAAGLWAGNYFYALALYPASDKSMVIGAPHNAASGPVDPEAGQRRDEGSAWFAASGYTDRYQTSYDGLRLHAYAVPQESAADWAILCHGYTGHGAQMTGSAKRFYDAGYSVLMPDARGHGQSEGAYIGMGWHDRLDIVGWIDQLLAEAPDAQIVLYGVSMGGATVMMTAGEALPANVKAIVEDCGYTSVWDEFAYQLKALFGLPAFPAMNLASLVTRVRTGYTLGEASAVRQLAKAETPILFIHGDADTFVPYSMLQQVYDACAAPKQMLIAPGAGHGEASSVLGEAYWDAIWDFLAQYV